MVDFPSGVSDQEPTFLIGGNANLNTPSKIPITPQGWGLLNAADQITARNIIDAADTASVAAAANDASTALANAASAQSAADTAQSTADAALGAASTAQSTADDANTTANSAMSAAGTAQSAAESAQGQADAAYTLATAAKNKVDAFPIVVSAQFTAPVPGMKWKQVIGYEMTITHWILALDAAGAIEFDVKVNGSTMIGGGNAPLLSTGDADRQALSGWGTTTLSPGDLLEFTVVSVTGPTQAHIGLQGTFGI